MNYIVAIVFVVGAWILAISLLPDMGVHHKVGLHLIIVPIALVIVEILR